jgi:hypothetical protein
VFAEVPPPSGTPSHVNVAAWLDCQELKALIPIANANAFFVRIFISNSKRDLTLSAPSTI